MTVAAPRVVEATLRSFVCAYSTYDEQPLRLGQLVAVREGAVRVFGIVADTSSGPDDPSRPLQPRGVVGQSAADVLADNPELRLLLRTRVSVVSCGWIEGETAAAGLPAVPPPLLARVEPASADETVRVAADGGFLALLLPSVLCDDAVIAAAISSAAGAFAPHSHEFVVQAGKELARLLKGEPSRLTSILRGIL